tara:strand:+ start:1428 stop:2084 length:657 start_codon:yes stop_codon:yes gene_type:complete
MITHYKGISQSEFHFVISEVVSPIAELTELYESLKEYSLPWNDYKQKYNPNKPNQPRGDGGLGAIYAPDKDGKDLIDYPVVQKIIKRFNFVNPNNTERDFHNVDAIDVAFMTYKPGFVFQKHTDRDMQYNLMFPIYPLEDNAPIHFWDGRDEDRDSTKTKLATIHYSKQHPTLTNGKRIHSVDEIKQHRVMFRIKTTQETFDEVRVRYEQGKFINVSS